MTRRPLDPADETTYIRRITTDLGPIYVAESDMIKLPDAMFPIWRGLIRYGADAERLTGKDCALVTLAVEPAMMDMDAMMEQIAHDMRNYLYGQVLSYRLGGWRPMIEDGDAE